MWRKWRSASAPDGGHQPLQEWAYALRERVLRDHIGFGVLLEEFSKSLASKGGKSMEMAFVKIHERFALKKYLIK